MKAFLIACIAVALLAAGCGNKSAQKSQPGENPLTAPADYVGAVAHAKVQAEKTIDLATVNNAIRLFYTAEGRFPNNLKELVDTGYLPVVPEPPPGMRLMYDPKTGTATMVKAQ
ncbi:MAG: hypothetical protein NZ739_04445 [Verrucomicrobiae bacterium]|nr:hypothetical protein [Verrucomicrobiae bacterium]MDW7980613.1 hypothetical protein [Verrucomicrobiales bacterium]